MNWSITDPRLYNEAFTGRAQSIARGSLCLQDDHSAAHCPHNPHRSYLGWIPELSAWPAFLPPNHHFLSRPSTQEICCRFNEGRCKSQRCRYCHACSACNRYHGLIDCLAWATSQMGGEAAPCNAPQQKASQGTRLASNETATVTLLAQAVQEWHLAQTIIYNTNHIYYESNLFSLVYHVHVLWSS